MLSPPSFAVFAVISNVMRNILMRKALCIYLLTFLEYINGGKIVLPLIKDYSEVLLYLMTITLH